MWLCSPGYVQLRGEGCDVQKTDLRSITPRYKSRLLSCSGGGVIMAGQFNRGSCALYINELIKEQLTCIPDCLVFLRRYNSRKAEEKKTIIFNEQWGFFFHNSERKDDDSAVKLV